MADTPKENEVKYNRFLNALTTLAPDKTFGGVNVADFTTQIGKSMAPRRKLVEIDDEKKQQEVIRNTEDAITSKMCEMIKNGVVADPEFGDDSALYEALGFIRRSERKSGLTRKKAEAEKK